MPLDIVRSTCPHDCPSVCALEVEVKDGKTIGRVRGSKVNTYTDGVICAKVARYAERIHHPERLTQPLLRTGAKGSGEFTAIPWDDALDRVASAIQDKVQQYDPTTVWPYHFAGTMGWIQRRGLERLRNDLGYSGQIGNICTFPADAGWRAGVGKILGPDPREMAQSDLIISWGGNPVSTQVNVMTHVAKARKRGAKFVVVDVYRTPSVEAADEAYILRPGTDVAFACALMHVLFRDGYADRDYLNKFAEDYQAFEAHLANKTPEWAAEITGISADRITAFAHEYGKTEKAYIRVGYGFSRSRNGSQQLHSVTCLPTVTGKWPTKGAGAFYNNREVYSSRIDETLIQGLDVADPHIRMLDMSRIGPVLVGEDPALNGGPPVTAMLIQNTNPASIAPEIGKVHEGFKRDDLFLCVHEQFMTDTAKFADIVLPATMFLEHDDIYSSGGHGHFHFAPKAIDGPEGCVSNHDLICQLAKRLGASHRGFDMTALDIIDETLQTSGLGGVAAIEDERWIDLQADFDTSHFINGFPTDSGRFKFKVDWASHGPYHDGLSALPDYDPKDIDAASAAHPFRLVVPPARNYLNSSFTETPTSIKREARPVVKVHPDVAADMGLSDGDLVALGNALGSVGLHAEIFAGLQPNVLIVEGVWPNHAFPGGVGINLLISAAPSRPASGGVFHDTAVWLKNGYDG